MASLSDERASGILLPLFSLPSPYGIGTMGQAAYDFVDFLSAAGQRYWQILPLGPTSFGDSPYQSFSTFAGNPYFIDLDLLIEEGLLTRDEVESIDWGADGEQIDYANIYANRFTLLKKAKERGYHRDREAIADFEEENASWLGDYALFMALKRHFGMRAWQDWTDDAIRLRRSQAVIDAYREQLREDVELFTYIQYLFFQQWTRLKTYCVEKGIGIIGDLPIYVASDSADIWAARDFFDLDEDGRQRTLAGVPPDAFSDEGQLWGNALYNWERMEADGYGWWIRRVAGAARLYDVIRIDHFRGLSDYWSIPAGESTAMKGHWELGPGMKLVRVLTGWFPNLRFIAEDLGAATPLLTKLLADSDLPGMCILEYAFEVEEESRYLPHNCTKNSVCYTGTHDNAPLALWQTQEVAENLAYCRQYLNIHADESLPWGLIRGGMGTVSCLFVAQLQDYLELGEGARINTPATIGNNWCWRLRADSVSAELAERIRDLTRCYGRLPKAPEVEAEADADATPLQNESSGGDHV